MVAKEPNKSIIHESPRIKVEDGGNNGTQEESVEEREEIDQPGIGHDIDKSNVSKKANSPDADKIVEENEQVELNKQVQVKVEREQQKNSSNLQKAVTMKKKNKSGMSPGNQIQNGSPGQEKGVGQAYKAMQSPSPSNKSPSKF